MGEMEQAWRNWTRRTTIGHITPRAAFEAAWNTRPSPPAIEGEGRDAAAIIHELQYIRVGMLDHFSAATILERLVAKAQKLSALPAVEGGQGSSVARLPAHVADATATDTHNHSGKEDQ